MASPTRTLDAARRGSLAIGLLVALAWTTASGGGVRKPPPGVIAQATRINKAFDKEYRTGQLSLEAFEQKHGLKAGQIAIWRNYRAFEGMFLPALIRNKTVKASLQADRLAELSADWKASVVTGKESKEQFRQRTGLSHNQYDDYIKADTKRFPEPEKLFVGVRDSMAARYEGDLDKIAREWSSVQEVFDRDRRRAKQRAFMSKWKIDDKALSSLKRKHPERFASDTGAIDDAKAQKLRGGWIEVLAGRLDHEGLYAAYKTSKSTFYNLMRSDPDGFPSLVTKAPTKKIKIDDAAVSDWERVESGELSGADFLERHGGRPVADTYRMVLASRAAVKDPLAPEEVEALERAWPDVLSGRRSADEVLREAKVPRWRVDAYNRRFRTSNLQIPDAQTAAQHDAIIADLIAVARKHKAVIRRFKDFVEVTRQDKGLQEKWGDLKLWTTHPLIVRDRLGDQALHKVLRDELDLASSLGRANERRGRPRAEFDGKGVGQDGGEDAGAVKSGERARVDSARAFAQALAGKTPSEATFFKIAAQLARKDPNLADRKQALRMRSTWELQFPEFKRWSFDVRRPYSLEYIARLTEIAHDLGPRASFAEVLERFQQTREFQEDGRVPNQKLLSKTQFDGVAMAFDTRRAMKITRLILERIRTNAEGASLNALGKALQVELGVSGPNAYARLDKLGREDVEAVGWSWAKFQKLRANKYRGLGEAVDPKFDHAWEPKGIDMHLVNAILDTPRLSDARLFLLALQRLDGKRPFANQSVLFVNHRYSDLVPFVDLMQAAGMAGARTHFVSTVYPFDGAVDYQLKQRGLEVSVPARDMTSFRKEVAAGLWKKVQRYEDQVQRGVTPEPILVIDDGGMAAKVLAEDPGLREHIRKFRFFEITAAGQRIAEDLKRDYGRLPWVYYTMAHDELKQTTTSAFHGDTVVRKTLALIPQTGKPLQNKRATVIGGGPMGLFAATALLREGHEVSIVEKDPLRAAAIRKEFKGQIRDYSTEQLDQALPGRGLVLGMTGYRSLPTDALRYVDDGAFVAQGSSKRNEYDMDDVAARALSRSKLPRTDGKAQESYSYELKLGGQRKTLHFLGDGWTINHDGSLHGNDFKDQELEMALLFEGLVDAVRTDIRQTGEFRVVGRDAIAPYVERWREENGKALEQRLAALGVDRVRRILDASRPR